MGAPSSATPVPDALSANHQKLAEKCEQAIRDGLVLQQWCHTHSGDLISFPLKLGGSYYLTNRATGYFGEVEINGEARSVMGCRQDVEFARLDHPDAPQVLQDFVLGQFLNRANWINPDGFPGGFGIERTLLREAGEVRSGLDEHQKKAYLDWRDLGSRFDWVMLTVQIHDFVMKFGPVTKRLKEAACVVAHPAFMRVVENPTEEIQLEVSIGYPFVEIAPVKNFFGFGPGKFGVAIKLYSFFLTRNNEIRVRMEFAAAPRCQKVFDFGKRWPDPVYGGAALLRRASFGRWNAESFHNQLDSQMLAQHCRVHQALMDGVAKLWKEWLIEGGS